MGELRYYLVKSPSGEGFIGKLVINSALNQHESIKAYCAAYPEVSPEQARMEFERLDNFIIDQAARGNSLVLDRIRVSPSMRGGFETIDSSYDISQNYINVNLTFKQGAIDDFQNKVSVKKIDRPQNVPEIIVIRDEKKDNFIHLDGPNTILGDNLHLVDKDYHLTEMIIRNIENNEQKEIIPVQMINLTRHTDKAINFTFKRAYTPPKFMVNDLEIYISLKYIIKETGKFKETEVFDTVWKSV